METEIENNVLRNLIIDTVEQYSENPIYFLKLKNISKYHYIFLTESEIRNLKDTDDILEIENLSVIKRKRSTSDLDKYYTTRKIRLDIQHLLKSIIDNDNVNSNQYLLNFFKSKIESTETYLSTLILFTLMYDEFKIIRKINDIDYILRIIKYCISYAESLNVELENWIDTYPKLINSICSISNEVVLFIQSMKKEEKKLKLQIKVKKQHN